MVSNFNTRFSLSSFVKRVNKLSEDQRSALKRMGFGHLLVIPNQTLSKNLLVELMDRWNCGKKAFEFPFGRLKITAMDVALILGLRVIGEPVVLNDDQPFSDLESDYGSSIEKRTISMTSLEKRLNSLSMVVNEDFIRTFLLFTFGTFLFPNSFGTVDSRYLLFLKDVDKVPLFAWGKVALEDMFRWMDKRKNDEREKYMGSCLILLQIWSYEHIDIARPTSPDCYLTFPRACRWKNSSYRLRQWFTNKFEELNENQIIWKLELTPEEMEIDVIRELLESENETIEVPSSQRSPTSVIVVNDDTLMVGSNRPESHAIEWGVSEVSLTKESMEVEEHSTELTPISEYASTSDANVAEASSRVQRKLEEEILELRREVEDLRRENELLRKCDKTVDGDNLRATEKLEKQILELRSEVDDLRRDNELLLSKHDNIGDKDNLKGENKLEEPNLELRKEADDLRRENELLKNQLMSLNNLADRLEKILYVEDINDLENSSEK